ncbi:MAG: 2TM domain-containing protein [Nitrososphaerota archaeon]|nr:2TM domain-containing protein [Nitrososphaerales archaeon]MDW8045096.1 2TM domain-containing protein [Nitrososphaerota archaeon]
MKALREIRMEKARRAFTVHLMVYIIVNIMLITINLMYTPETIWFFYPLLGWGIGIAIHYYAGVVHLPKELEEEEALAERRARK